MPSLESSTAELDNDQVTVRNANQYGTLWSQYLPLTNANLVFYIVLAPFFITQFILTLLSSTHLIFLINPEVYSIEIPSTTTNPPNKPVAYTADSETTTTSTALYTRVIRLCTVLPIAIYAYLSRQKVAYITSESVEVIDDEKYIIAEDEDSLRPYVLFR